MRPLERLRKELGSLDLPPAYVAHTLEEVSGHVEEAMVELIGDGYAHNQARELAEDRLGSPQELAHQFYARRAACSFWLRHPFLATSGVSLGLFLLLSGTQLALLALLSDSVTPNTLVSLQRAAEELLPLAGAVVLYRTVRLHVGRLRWLSLSVGLFLFLKVTSVVTVEHHQNGQRTARFLLLAGKRSETGHGVPQADTAAPYRPAGRLR